MSMREYPSSGYVVPLARVEGLLTVPDRQNLAAMLEENDPETIIQFLVDRLPDWFPDFSLYRPSEEDTVDGENMAVDEWYMLFDESDLFTKSPTAVYNRLIGANLEPVAANWSVWG